MSVRACLMTTLVGGLALSSRAAHAWPVDVIVEVPAGGEQMRKLAALSWAEVEDENIATLEVLDETSELLISGRAPGSTLALLSAEGRFAVWRIHVRPEREGNGRSRPARLELEKAAQGRALAAARERCRGLEVDSDDTLRATIADDPCREALLTLFQTDRFHSRQLALTFEVSALQEQLKRIEAALGPALAAKLSLAYRGAGLELRGEVTEAERRRVYWTLFRHSVGRVALDDKTQTPIVTKTP